MSVSNFNQNSIANQQNSIAGISMMKYNVDLVYCIDATRSMDPILDIVKNNAVNFYDDFKKKMSEKNKPVGRLRMRIVAFRDYYYDHEEAMLVTDFFEMPRQAEELRACVASITADGGGDAPEDGLEALAYAIRSNWNTQALGKRQIIVVWSDESTHELGFGKRMPNYPTNMAKDFDELSRWWGSDSCPGLMDNHGKRLLIFAPAKKYWTTIVDNWDNAILYESEAGKGLDKLGYEEIINAIAYSIVEEAI